MFKIFNYKKLSQIIKNLLSDFNLFHHDSSFKCKGDCDTCKMCHKDVPNNNFSVQFRDLDINRSQCNYCGKVFTKAKEKVRK